MITEVRDPENAKAFNVQSLNNLSQTIYRGLKQASCYMPNAMMRFMVHDANMRDLYEQINLVGDVVRLTPVGRSFARVSLADDEEARPLYEYWTYNERWAVMKAEHCLLEGGATPMPTGSAIFRAAAGVARSGQPVTVDSILEAIAEAEEEASADEVVNNGGFVDDSALVLGSTSDEVEEAEVEALEADEVANHGGFIDDASLFAQALLLLALSLQLQPKLHFGRSRRTCASVHVCVLRH